MAMSVTYTTINGQIVHENRGGPERFYIPDPLGNTAALVDMNRAVTDTWSYWPYGEIQSHGGPSMTALAFLGTLGYFTNFLNELYIKARALRVDLTRWATSDPMWPRGAAYSYCDSAPTTLADPDGTDPCTTAKERSCALFCYPYDWYCLRTIVKVGAPICGYYTVVDVENCFCNL